MKQVCIFSQKNPASIAATLFFMVSNLVLSPIFTDMLINISFAIGSWE